MAKSRAFLAERSRRAETARRSDAALVAAGCRASTLAAVAASALLSAAGGPTISSSPVYGVPASSSEGFSVKAAEAAIDGFHGFPVDVYSSREAPVAAPRRARNDYFDTGAGAGGNRGQPVVPPPDYDDGDDVPAKASAGPEVNRGQAGKPVQQPVVSGTSKKAAVPEFYENLQAPWKRSSMAQHRLSPELKDESKRLVRINEEVEIFDEDDLNSKVDPFEKLTWEPTVRRAGDPRVEEPSLRVENPSRRVADQALQSGEPPVRLPKRRKRNVFGSLWRRLFGGGKRGARTQGENGEAQAAGAPAARAAYANPSAAQVGGAAPLGADPLDAYTAQKEGVGVVIIGGKVVGRNALVRALRRVPHSLRRRRVKAGGSKSASQA